MDVQNGLLVGVVGETRRFVLSNLWLQTVDALCLDTRSLGPEAWVLGLGPWGRSWVLGPGALFWGVLRHTGQHIVHEIRGNHGLQRSLIS